MRLEGMGRRTRKLCKTYFIFPMKIHNSNSGTVSCLCFAMDVFNFFFCIYMFFQNCGLLADTIHSIYGTFRFVGNCLCLGKYVIFLSRGYVSEERHSFSKLGLRQLLLCPCLQATPPRVDLALRGFACQDSWRVHLKCLRRKVKS